MNIEYIEDGNVCLIGVVRNTPKEGVIDAIKRLSRTKKDSLIQIYT